MTFFTFSQIKRKAIRLAEDAEPEHIGEA